MLNDSTYTINFDFRWTSSSPWEEYSEAPGQGEIFWNTYANVLTPQVLYATTTGLGSQTTVSLAQGYGEWTGSGTPPASAAKLYQFQNTITGVELYYAPDAPTPPTDPDPTAPYPVAPVAPTLPSGAAPNADSSPNWSGYVVGSNLSNPQANSVTYVVGTWNVPAVSAPSSYGTFDSSAWVGIDGFGDGTVEQLGTEQDVVNGLPVYRAWWEMYSSGLRQPEQVITGMTIMPGDSITASVQYITSGAHSGQFLLSIVDNSRSNDSFSTYQTSASTQSPLAQRSVAEWIMEAPSVGGSIATMPTFSTINFTNATATINGVSGGIGSSTWTTQALNLVSNGVPIDTTSVIGDSGESFSVSSNSGVGAGVESDSGIQTTPGQLGSPNPQVIVVGRRTPPLAALQLVVVGQPASVSVGVPFGLTIVVVDGNGNVVTDYNGPITVHLAGGTGGGGLGGILTLNAVDGVATFSDLTLTAAGMYTIGIQGASLGSTAATISVSGAGGQAGPPAAHLGVDLFNFVSPTVIESPPQVLGIAALTHSHQKLTKITLAFDEALNAVSAERTARYHLRLATRKRGRIVYKKAARIRSVVYNSANHTVTLALFKPTKGHFQLTVAGGEMGANGATNPVGFVGYVR